MTTPVERKRRRIRAVGYLCFATLGTVALWWPAPIIQAVTTQSFFDRAGYLWALLLIIGGLSSAWGALWRKWPGEYVGLVALMIVMAVYATVAMLTGVKTEPPAPATAFGWAGMFFIWLCRWIKVDCIRREAEHEKKRSDQQAEQTRRLTEPGEDDGAQ